MEVWCPAFTGRESCAAIINHNLKAEFKQSGKGVRSMHCMCKCTNSLLTSVVRVLKHAIVWLLNLNVIVHVELTYQPCCLVPFCTSGFLYFAFFFSLHNDRYQLELHDAGHYRLDAGKCVVQQVRGSY